MPTGYEDLYPADLLKPKGPEEQDPLGGYTETQVRGAQAVAPTNPEVSKQIYAGFLQGAQADEKEQAAFLEWQAQANAAGKSPGGVMETAHLRASFPALRDLSFDYVYEKRNELRTEAMMAGVDFAEIRRNHPVLEKYIRDPEKAVLALEDSATLQGWETVFGRAGKVEFTDPVTGVKAWVPDEKKDIGPSWYGAFRDAATKGVPLLMAQSLDWMERILAPIDGGKVSGEFRQTATLIKQDMAKDYWGTFSGDRDGIPFKAKSALATGLDFVTSQWPILAASWGAGGISSAFKLGVMPAAEGLTAIQAGSLLAKAATPGVTAINAVWFAPAIFERIDEATKGEHPVLATLLALPTAGAVGRLMAAGPVGTVAGAGSATRASRFVEEGLTRHLFGALEKEGAMSLAGNAAARFGYHFLLGKTTFALQQATEQIAVEAGRSLGLGESPDPRRVAAAFHEGWQAGDAAWLMSGLGVARTMYREMGRMVEAKRTGQMLDRLMDVTNIPKTNIEWIDGVAKEIASKGNPVIYVDAVAYMKAAEMAGVDPKKFWQETLGLATPAYEAVIDSKGSDFQIPVEKARLLADSKHFADVIRNFGRFNLEDYSAAMSGKLALKMLPHLEDVIKKGPDAFNAEERAIYDDKYASTLTAIGVSNEVSDPKQRERVADTAARLILGYVKGIQRELMPNFTLDQVYQETWGKVGMFGAKEIAPGQLALYHGEEWAPAFYSGVEKALTTASRKKGNVQAWLNDLKKGGAKPEEMHDIKLEGFLAQFGKGEIAREQLLEYVRDAQLRVEVKLNQDAQSSTPEREALNHKYEVIEAKYEEYKRNLRDKVRKFRDEEREKLQTEIDAIDELKREEFLKIDDRIEREWDEGLAEVRAHSNRWMEDLRAKMGEEPPPGAPEHERTAYDIRVEKFLADRREHESNMDKRRVERERRANADRKTSYDEVTRKFDPLMQETKQRGRDRMESLDAYRDDLMERIDKKRIKATREWLRESAALGDVKAMADAIEWNYQSDSQKVADERLTIELERGMEERKAAEDRAKRLAPYMSAFDTVERRYSALSGRPIQEVTVAEYRAARSEMDRLGPKLDRLRTRIETISEEHRKRMDEIQAKYLPRLEELDTIQNDIGVRYHDAQAALPAKPEYHGYTLQGEIPGTYREYTVHVPEAMQGWGAPHFAQSGHDADLVFHFRTSIRADENGKPMFFIEEIQSDPIQAAVTNLEHAEWRLKNLDAIYERKKADHIKYTSDRALPTELRDRIEIAKETNDPSAVELQKEYDRWMDSATRGEFKMLEEKKAKELTRLQGAIEAEGFGPTSKRKVPASTPFRESWETQAVKRIIRIAAEEGHERIGWTVGKTQQERYRLTQVADKIHWKVSYDNGEPVINARGVKVEDKSQYKYEIIDGETDAGRLRRLEAQGYIEPGEAARVDPAFDMPGSYTVKVTYPDGRFENHEFDTRKGAERFVREETGTVEWTVAPRELGDRYDFGVETYEEVSIRAEMDYTREPSEELKGKFRASYVDKTDNGFFDGWFPTREAAEAWISEKKKDLTTGFVVTEKGDRNFDTEQHFDTREEADKFVADYAARGREVETEAGSWRWDALEARRHIGSKATKIILDSGETSGTLQGEALEVGGKGMTSAYDERIPNIFKKLIKADKRYGEPEISKVKIPLDTSDAARYSAENMVRMLEGGPYPSDLVMPEGVDAWVAKIPKALAQDALTKGFALYQVERDAAEKARIIEEIQKAPFKIKGAYIPEEKAIVLLPTANQRTPIHEITHAFDRMLYELWQDPRFTAGVEKMYDAALKAMGRTLDSETWADKPGVRPPIEKFPYHFEQYVLSGNVPDPALVPVFAHLFEMLGDPRIDPMMQSAAPGLRYEAANKLKLGDLPPEVKGLFDSMLLSREALHAAEGLARITYLNPELRKLMEPEEREKYDAEVSNAFTASRDALIRAVSESRRFFVAEERKRLQLGAAEEIKSDPQYRMLNFFRTGKLWGDIADQAAMLKGPDGKPLRFNARDVEYLMGTETLTALKNKRGLISEKGDSIPLDIAAQIFGFKGADAMLAALRDAQPTVKEAVRLRSEAVLQSMYRGWLVDDHQALAGAAMDAVQTAQAGVKILRELRTLARQLTDDPTAQQRINMTPEAWDKLAERLADTKLLGELRPEALAAAAGRAVQRAQEAIEKGDYRAAFNEMDGAMINHAMYKHVRRLHTEFGKAYEILAERATSDSWRAKLGLADPTYRKLNDALLFSIELDDNNEHSAAKSPKILEEFLTAVKANGQESQLSEQWDPAVINELLQGTKAWKTLTQEEAWQVLRAVKNIQQIAKTQNEIQLHGQMLYKESLIGAAERHLAGMTGIPGPLEPNYQIADTRAMTPGKAKEVAAHLAKLAGAKLDEPRIIMGFLGPEMKDATWGAFTDARTVRNQLLKRVFEKSQEIWAKYDSTDLMRVLPGLETELPLKQIGLEGPVTKAWLMTVMRWMGTEESRAKMLRATGWNADQVTEAAGKYLTAEDMNLIQQEHRLFETELKPLEAEVYERRTGLDFVSAKAMAYEVNGIKYEGGYWPIKYDRRVGSLGFALDQATLTEDMRGFPSTPKGHLQPRSGYVDVPDFNWDGYPSHVLGVIHDVAFGDWVRDTGKILLDKRMKAAMASHLGPEYYDEIRPWLWRVARDATGSVEESQRGINHALGWSRSALVYSAIGWNIGVAADFFHPIAAGLMQEGSGYVVKYSTPSWLRTVKDGMSGLMGGKNATRQFALDNSPALQNREATIEHDLRMWFDEMLTPKNMSETAIQKVRDTAFWHIQQMDKMISTMIWDAKYRQSMDAGVGHELAVRLADHSVEGSMPTYSRMEMPSLHADRDKWVGSLLMFRGYWSKLYQMAHEQGHEMIYRPMLEGASTKDRLFDASAWAGRMMGMLTIGAVFGDLMLGHGPRPEEDWDEWFIRRELAAPANLIPFASNLAEPVAYKIVHGRWKRPMSITAPGFAYYEQFINTIGKIATNTTSTEDKVQATIELGLMGLRLPARAPVRAGRYVYDRVFEGRYQDAGPLQDLSGVLYGQKSGPAARNQELTPFTAIGGRRGE